MLYISSQNYPFPRETQTKKFRKFNSEIKIPILRKIDYFSRSFYHHFHDRFKSNHFTFCHFGRGGRNKTVRIGVDQRYLPGNNPISRYPGLRITTHQSGYFHGCSFITGKYPLHYLRIRYHLQQRNANDIDRKTLTLVPATDERLYYYDGNSYWRLTIYIAGSKTFEQVTPDLAYQTGRAFGEFQYFLSDIPNPPIGATIPDFHNMEFRLGQFREAIARDKAACLAKVQPIVDELLDVLRKCAGLNGFIAKENYFQTHYPLRYKSQQYAVRSG